MSTTATPHNSAPLLHTVAGPLSAASVTGPALTHEHLVLDLDLKGDGAAVLDARRHGPAVGRELAELREEFGLCLVVEQTCRGMGRGGGARRPVGPGGRRRRRPRAPGVRRADHPPRRPA
ncbi:hypothetical protein ACFW4X_22530, partial [Streptomyces smyrnaeus]